MKVILLPKDGGKTMAAVRWLGESRHQFEFRVLMVRHDKARKEAMKSAEHFHPKGHPLGWHYAVTTPDRWPNVLAYLRSMTENMHPLPTVVIGVDDVDRVLAVALGLPPHFLVGMITADKEE